MLDLGTLTGHIKLEGADAFKKGLDDAGKTASNAGNLLSGAFKGAVVAGAAVATACIAAGAAIKGLADETAAYGDKVDKQSQKMGVSAEAYQEWAYVLERNGASIDSLQVGMKTLNKQIEAGSDAFGKLDVSVKNTDGSFRSTEDIMKDSIMALADMEEGAERTALANELFGSKVGQELAPMLNSGSAGIEELMARAEELGIVMSDDAVKASAEYTDAMTDLNMSMDGIKRTIGSAFLPIITKVVNTITTKVIPPISRFISQVSSKVQPVLEKIGNYIKNNFTPVLQKIGDFIKTNIMPVVSSVVSEISSKVVPALQAIGSWIGEHIMPVVESFGNFLSTEIFPIIQGIASWIGETFKPIADWLYDWFINSLLPALGNLWDTYVTYVQPVLETVWQWIKENIIPVIKEVGQWIQENLLPIIQDIATFISETLIPTIQDIVQWIGDAVQAIIDFAQTVSDKIAEVIQWFTDLPTNITNAVGDLSQTLVDAGGDVIQGLWDGMTGAWDGVTKWFGNITASIPKLKGPEAVDKKLLYPAGQWIIEGLQNGLESSVPALKKTLAGITNTISGTNFNATAQLAYSTASGSGAYALGQVAAPKSQTTNVYINGTRINDDPAIEAKFTELMYMLARKGNM